MVFPRTPKTNHDDNTKKNSCQICEEQDDDLMVQCDTCDKWYHFKCVGVTEEVANKDWNCEECVAQISAQVRQNRSQIQPNKETTDPNTVNSSHSNTTGQIPTTTKSAAPHILTQKSTKLATVNQMQASSAPATNIFTSNQQNVNPNNGHDSLRLNRQVSSFTSGLLHGNPLNPLLYSLPTLQQTELESAATNQIPPCNTNRPTGSLRRTPSSHKSINSLRNLQLEKLEEEKRLQQEEIRILREYNEKKFKLLEEAIDDSSITSSVFSDNNQDDRPLHEVSKSQHIKDWVINQAHHKNVVKDMSYQNPNNDNKFLPPNKVAFQSPKQTTNSRPVNNNNENTLNSTQLAARQVMPKELPYFSGNPMEWALFMSMYETTTAQCGFSDAENMVRLQKSLKGTALEAVRYQLLRPELVNEVIKTLSMMFGRPEHIIDALIDNIRKQPPPKIDNFNSIINYSLAVKNLCATMEVSGLVNHLQNPTLMKELIQKLPASTRLQWATYKRKYLYETADISSFSAWLNEIAQDACEVSTIPVGLPMKQPRERSQYVNVTQKFEPTEKKTAQPPSGNASKCFVCDQIGHTPPDCKTFQQMTRNKRWETTREKKLCKRCLVSTHPFYKCQSTQRCGVDGCPRKHHHLLHTSNSDVESQPQNTPTQNKEPSTNATERINSHQHSTPNVFFRIVPVTLSSAVRSIHTFALLDDGSSVTILDNDLADELQLEGRPESLCLKWTGETIRREEDSRKVNVNISARDSDQTFTLNGVRTVRKLGLPNQTLNVDNLTSTFTHLKGIPLLSYNKATPRILIGLDNWYLAIPQKVKEGFNNAPIATKTRLGWVLGGPNNNNEVLNQYVGFHNCECGQQNNSELTELVKRFYVTETYDTGKSVQLLESKEDARARELLIKTTRRIDDGCRYETGLLWKFDKIEFPDSYQMALRRLNCFESKMQKDPELHQIIHQQIKDYITKGYIRKLTNDETKKGPRTWFIPMFSVRNPNKPKKVRIVWDAAAKVQGISLNSMLLKGPDQLSSLLGILYRSREKPIAICGDIREMYHQVVIKKDDQDSQRFLYRQNTNQPPDQYVMQVMTFGATCSPSSAQFVKNLNATEQVDKYPRAHKAITINHYVDDWFQSMNTEQEAIDVAKEVRTVHSFAGFEIRNWISNSQNVLLQLDEPKALQEKSFMDPNIEKVLGMFWDTSTDSFRFHLNRNKIDAKILTGARPTKREVLKIMMTVFDPIGLIAHFLVYIKILMQDVWRTYIDWDEPILEDEYEKWCIWINLLPMIEEIAIPRCYLKNLNGQTIESTQLHIFVDSSEKAYACVAYYRYSSQNEIKCSLIGGKTKVTPLKATSIPRLELQAAVLGSRLKNSIISEHNITPNNVALWTDSSTVLGWLHSDQRKYKPFVGLRIAEILDSTEPHNWRWIPTKMNVADEATKWKGPSTISDNSQWFTAPAFLYLNESEWPSKTFSSKDSPIEELKQIMTHSIPEENLIPNIEAVTDEIVNFNNFSQWRRLRRAQAYFMRARDFFLKKRRNIKPRYGPLTMDEICKAENEIFRYVQRQNYSNEITLLQTGQPLTNKSQLHQLTPYLDKNGVLRIRGRIDAIKEVPFDVKRPIILPQKSQISKLIVHNKHIQFLHHNNETVVNELRQVYHIPHLRTLLRQVIRNHCQDCKINNARPQPPEMAQLPPERLSARFRPFTNTGVDFFGPVEVTIGRRHEKRWGMIFTCLTIRALHIELASSLNTSTCIMCLRNFISRRGQPRKIFSDNGTNFVGTKNELHRELQKLNRKDWAESVPEIEWNFITPSSPHMGGAWERMVRSIKTNLQTVLSAHRPSEEVLRSTLIEIEGVINSRPLSYVALETDADEALTPNHFLLGTSNGYPPPGDFNEKDDLRKSWKTSQAITNHFWNRWIKEVLPTIVTRPKWFDKQAPVSIGTPVLIVDEKLRNSWTRGIIVDVITSKDNQIRTVVVKTNKGVYTRPIVKIAILDVTNKNKSTDLEPLLSSNGE